MVGGIFFALGHFARHRLPPAKPLAGLLVLAVSVSLALLNGRVDLFTMQFNQPMLYLVAGVTGAWDWCRFAQFRSCSFLRSSCR